MQLQQRLTITSYMSGLLQWDLTSGFSVKQQTNENNERSDTGAMRRFLKLCQTSTRISECSKATWQRRHTESKSTDFIICRSRWPRNLRCGAAENAGSNPAGGMDVYLLWVLCCQAEVLATSRSFVQRSHTESVCVCPWMWSDTTITLYTCNE